VSITYVSNTLINFIIPPQVTSCNSTNSKIIVNGVTTIFSFTFDATLNPTVTSLSFQSASPIMKQNLNVSGTNFGTLNDTKAYLYSMTDNTKSY
jgi:hypothetical protein